MRPLSDFTTLTFDCYGTLIDWEAGILAELRPWADARGLVLTNDELLETFGATEVVVEVDHPTHRYPQILEEVLRRLSSRFQVITGDDAVRDFGQSVGRWPAFPDSPAVESASGTNPPDRRPRTRPPHNRRSLQCPR